MKRKSSTLIKLAAAATVDIPRGYSSKRLDYNDASSAPRESFDPLLVTRLQNGLSIRVFGPVLNRAEPCKR